MEGIDIAFLFMHQDGGSAESTQTITWVVQTADAVGNFLGHS